MDDRHLLFDHLALWTQRLIVDDNKLCSMQLAQISNKIESESGESILVSNDQICNLARLDTPNQIAEPLPLEVQAAAYLGYPLINHNALRKTKLLQHLHLLWSPKVRLKPTMPLRSRRRPQRRPGPTTARLISTGSPPS